MIDHNGNVVAGMLHQQDQILEDFINSHRDGGYTLDKFADVGITEFEGVNGPMAPKTFIQKGTNPKKGAGRTVRWMDVDEDLPDETAAAAFEEVEDRIDNPEKYFELYTYAQDVIVKGARPWDDHPLADELEVPDARPLEKIRDLKKDTFLKDRGIDDVAVLNPINKAVKISKLMWDLDHEHIRFVNAMKRDLQTCSSMMSLYRLIDLANAHDSRLNAKGAASIDTFNEIKWNFFATEERVKEISRRRSRKVVKVGKFAKPLNGVAEAHSWPVIMVKGVAKAVCNSEGDIRKFTERGFTIREKETIGS